MSTSGSRTAAACISYPSLPDAKFATDRWCFTYQGEPMRAVGSAWERSLRRAGIEAFRFHDLRHTWASWHVMSGTSLPELMELGGWKSYQMVLRYAHLAPEHLSAAAQRIERAWDVVDGKPHDFPTLENSGTRVRA